MVAEVPPSDLAAARRESNSVASAEFSPSPPIFSKSSLSRPSDSVMEVRRPFVRDARLQSAPVSNIGGGFLFCEHVFTGRSYARSPHAVPAWRSAHQKRRAPLSSRKTKKFLPIRPSIFQIEPLNYKRFSYSAETLELLESKEGQLC